MVAFYVTILIAVLLFLKISTAFWLSFRQEKHVLSIATHPAAPAPLIFSAQETEKTVNYTRSRLGFSRFSLIFSTLVFLGWTFFGGIETLDRNIIALGLPAFASGPLFLWGFAMISMLIGVPLSLYDSFVIEKKFGFNRTTPGIFILDLLKSLLLLSLLGIPIFAGLLWIMKNLGSWWWFWGWVAMSLVSVFLVWLYPAVIAPLFNKFSPLPEGELSRETLKLARITNLACSGVFVMDASKRSSHGNAFFTGLGKTKRIVFFDTLLKDFTTRELLAILAHEIGHQKRGHIPKMMVLQILSLFVSFAVMGFLFNQEWFFQSLGVLTPSSTTALVLFTLVSGLFTFWFSPLENWFLRRHEFEADAFACKYAGQEALASGLIRLYRENSAPVSDDPLYALFYRSHPCLLERVERSRQHQ
jgi:STE24 endopeptidase